MNTVRQIQALNKRELETGVGPGASWHRDYDSAYIFIGGLPFDLSEGDIVTIFSQYGEPVHINLVRDKETGKSKGFAYLKYEDQRSTDLAVDNLGGATVMGRVLRVDHTNYKRKEDEVERVGPGPEQTTHDVVIEDDEGGMKRRRRDQDSETSPSPRPQLKEEHELAALIRDHDDEDPMKAYLVQQKREEVREAIARMETEPSNGHAKSMDAKLRKRRISGRERSADSARSEARQRHRKPRYEESEDNRQHRSRRHRTEN